MRFISFIFCLSLFSCGELFQKEEHTFIYDFENKTQISPREVDVTIDVLKKRLNSFGLKNEVKRIDNNEIKVSVWSNELDKDRVNNLLLNKGKLEFWELYKGNAVFPFLEELTRRAGETKMNPFLIGLLYVNEAGNTKMNPLLGLVAANDYTGPVIYQFKAKDTAQINTMLHKKEVKRILSEYLQGKFLWGKADSNGYHPLYAVKFNRKSKAALTGEVITNAISNVGVTGKPEISMEMDENGAQIWERITSEAFRDGTNIAIVINDLVYSAPGVAEPIKGGISNFSGNFTIEETQDLAIILSSQQSIPKLKLIDYLKVKN